MQTIRSGSVSGRFIGRAGAASAALPVGDSNNGNATATPDARRKFRRGTFEELGNPVFDFGVMVGIFKWVSVYQPTF